MPFSHALSNVLRASFSETSIGHPPIGAVPIPSSVISNNNSRLKVVFIFGFTKSSLDLFINWDETENELREPNEFLRILDNDEKIRAVFLDKAYTSLDTKEDLKRIREIMQNDSYFPKYKSF